MTTINTHPEFDNTYYGRGDPENNTNDPTSGDFYFDILSLQGYVYDGTLWIPYEDEAEKQKFLQNIKQKQSTPEDDYDRAMRPLRNK